MANNNFLERLNAVIQKAGQVLPIYSEHFEETVLRLDVDKERRDLMIKRLKMLEKNSRKNAEDLKKVREIYLSKVR